MKLRALLLASLVAIACLPSSARADALAAQKTLLSGVNQIMSVLAPAPDSAPRTFSTTLRIVRATGLPQDVVGREAALAFQAPDKLRLSAKVGDETYSAGRNGGRLWMHVAGKKFGVIGSPDAPRFKTDEGRPDGTKLPPLKLPVTREQLLLLPLLCSVETLPDEAVLGELCAVLRLTPKSEARAAMNLPAATVTLWLRKSDDAPLRIGYADGRKVEVIVELDGLALEPAWPDSAWNLQAGPEDKIETVALGHLTRFLPAALDMLGQKLPPLDRKSVV